MPIATPSAFLAAWLLIVLPVAAPAAGPAADPAAGGVQEPLNGFVLTPLTVPRASILAGGPARDAIHSVDSPSFVPPSEATRWVRAETPVIGLGVGSEAHVYPVHVMEFHQVVNDVVGGVPVVVTYDPLTDVAVAYRARQGQKALRFGVSGLIHRCNFLLYDHETESLWSQMLGTAVAGKEAGAHLQRLQVRVETLSVWLQQHPESVVMRRPEPDKIDYRYSRYTSYWISDRIPFPVEHRDERFHPKELVLGVEVDGKARAYLGSILTRAGSKVADEFEGRPIRIQYDGETGTFVWDAPQDVEVTHAYWFAWKEFHPDTSIWNEDSVPAPE